MRDLQTQAYAHRVHARTHTQIEQHMQIQIVYSSVILSPISTSLVTNSNKHTPPHIYIILWNKPQEEKNCDTIV